MISVVVKAFTGPDGPIPSGAVLDSSSWRNEQQLVNCRFIRPATDDEAAAFRAATPTPGRSSSPRAQATESKKGTRRRR